jgi:methyl-accepting chemotaxis protein WspA
MSLRTRLVLAAIVVVLSTAGLTAAVITVAAQAGWFAMPSGLAAPSVAMAAAVAGVLAIIPSVSAAVWIAQSIMRPIDDATAVAEAAATGRAAPHVTLGGSTESAKLIASIVAVQHAVGGLVAVIQSAAARLAAVETDTTAALRHEQEAVRAFSGSASEITAAVAEISATSEHLLAATGDVMASAREAGAVADDGRAGLERMAVSIQHLDEAMNAFTRKLSTISQRAAGITAVVTTIAKVAEQTNLLSVNATIEAEKAGESGRGFRIVAQEIRRLADQTALSTKDIERLVRDMQAAVAGGTMEMDRFRNEVSSRLGEVAAVSAQLGRVIDPVHSVTRSLAVVHEGMAAQSEGARQIRTAMESLRGDAAESTASLAAFAAAVEAVRGAAADLHDAASQFSEGT